MAIQHFLRTVWSARLTDSTYRRSTYLALCNRNWEADSANARTVRIGAIGDVDVRDYTKDTDITFDTLDDSSQDLTLDQMKYFGFAVDDVDKAQSNAPIMEAAMVKAGRSVARVVDNYLQNFFDDAVAGNRITYGTAPGSVTDGYLDAFGQMKEKILQDDHALAEEGLNIVLPPEVARRMENHITTTGASLADAVIRGGFVGTMLGFNVHVTNSVNKTSTNWNCPVTVGTTPITFASQIAKIEAGRQEKRFNDYVKGLYVYAGKVVQPDWLYRLDLKV